VLVYPTTFVARREETSDAGLVSHTTHEMLGESWSTGLVVFAWDEIMRSVARENTGQNVILHEFAHQLDQEDGSDNGAPVLRSRSDYASWSQVFAREFAELQRRASNQQESLLDPYGATNPAEFFAVATEAFFERSLELQTQHGELYEELRKYYRVNPVEWREKQRLRR
jgi:Mlc titration factor MtfA (ptsG expression regulator)